MTRALMIAVLSTLLWASPHPAMGEPQSTVPGFSPLPQQTRADTNPERIAKIRAQAQARRNARRVRVELLDGTVTRGRAVGVTDQTIAVQPSPSDEPVLFDFSNVKSIDGAGTPRWVWTAAGVGAAAAVIAAIAAGN